jgi:hypothetical protein
MANESIGSPLERYAAVNSFMMKDVKTLDCSYKSFMEFLSQSSWKSDAVKGGSELGREGGREGGRAWDIWCCGY